MTTVIVKLVDENETLRRIVRKLVIEPADSADPAYYCAGWLDATDEEVVAIRRALGESR